MQIVSQLIKIHCNNNHIYLQNKRPQGETDITSTDHRNSGQVLFFKVFGFFFFFFNVLDCLII